MYIGHPEAFGPYFVKNFPTKPINRQLSGYSEKEIAQLKEIAIKFFCYFSIIDNNKLPKDWLDALLTLGNFFTKDGKKALRSKKAILTELKQSGGIEFRPKPRCEKRVYEFTKNA